MATTFVKARAVALLGCLLAVAGQTESNWSGAHAEQLQAWRQSLRCHGEASLTKPSSHPASDVTWELIGEGAHRQLHYHIPVTALQHATQCQILKVHLAVPLPVEVFTDPYQLAGISKSHRWLNLTILGKTDLESPAPESEPTTLVIAVDIQTWQHQQVTHPLTPATDSLHVTVPVHNRYPTPDNSTGADDPRYGGAWWATLVTGMVTVDVPRPYIVTVCCASQQQGLRDTHEGVGSRDEHGNSASNHWLCHEHPQAVPDVQAWSIPTGSLQHADVVSIGTLVSAVFASATILAVLFRDKLAAASSPGGQGPCKSHHE